MQILGGELIRNATNQNAMGGTELLGTALHSRLDQELLKDFQIILSRPSHHELDESKIRICWLHDLPGDPESDFLSNKSNHDNFHMYVFVSNWQMQGYINHYGLPWSKCAVLENAIVPIEAHTKPDPKEQINLIYFSTPHRGLDILVTVFEELVKHVDNIHLDVYSSFELYGWAERDKPFEPLYDVIRNHENMTYHSSVSNEEIREALKKAHILAYPSTWLETSCLVLIEAMSAGLVPVHPNYGALYETAAGNTCMYQYNEVKNRHASVFFGVLKSIIESYRAEPDFTTAKCATGKSFADIQFAWDQRQVEWSTLLSGLLQKVTDRSLPDNTLTFNTGS